MKDEAKTKRQLMDELKELRQDVAALQKVEEELTQVKESQQKFTKAFMQNSIPMSITTLKEGRFVEVSVIFLKLMGLERDKVIGNTFTGIGFITEEQRAMVLKELNKKGRVENLELQVRTKGGEVRYGLFNAVMMTIGNEKYLHTVMTDITERKRAEEALIESEEQFRGLIENMPIGIFIYEGTKVRYINPACERITGYTRSELYLNDIWEIAHPEYKDIIREYVKRRQRKEPVPELHAVKIVTKNGEERWVERNAIAIELGGKSAVLVTIMDITERRHTEEALRKSEERYRAILESASDAIVLADEQGNVIEANRMAENFFGYLREELVQMHYTQLHPMMEMENTTAAFKHIVTRGKGCLQNTAILRKDGMVVPADITGSVIEYDGRKVLLGSFRDISEHKNAKEILERLVGERTAELSEKNKQLAEEVMERKRTEAALRKKTKQIQLHANKFQELNTALKVLLKQREEDKRELEEKVLANVKELLIPYLEELKKGRMDARSEMQVSILEANLNNIISPFTHRLSSRYSGFTPREIQVASLIRQGISTKDIAKFLGISRSAINLYRNSIRHKLGIITKKINLRSHLMALS